MKVKKSSKIAQDTTVQNLPPSAAIFQESEYTSDEESTNKEQVDNDKENNHGVVHNASEKQISLNNECNQNNCKEKSSCPTSSKIAKLDKQQSKSKKGFDAITGKNFSMD